MHPVYSAVLDMGASRDWLVTANFILSILLMLWMLRYRRLYLSAREEQSNSRDLIENLSEGIYRSTPEGKQLSANRALVRLNGYESEAEMLAGIEDIGKEWYVDPNRRDEFRALLRKHGKVENFVSEIYRHKTRERIWITESARLVCDKKTGQPKFYEGSVREITETVNRLQVEEQFRKLTSQVPGALFQFEIGDRGETRILYVSPGFERITGISPEAVTAQPKLFGDGIHGDDRARYSETLLEATRTLSFWDHEHRFVRPDGEVKWLRVTATPERTGSAVTWHGYLADISVRKSHEMEIEKLAYFDTLTMLPNRRMFLDRMARAVEGCAERRDRGALLFIDLDNFKTLNDTQGHDVGDDYLKQVAARLRRCVGTEDLVARIGGDEFVVIIEAIGMDDANASRRAIMVANQVLAALREPFDLGHLRHKASASLGVVVFGGDDQRAEDILKRADIAMYEVKASGRNGLALFDPASLGQESERFELLADLRQALAGNELELHFQPQMDENGEVAGAEALLRWDHPRHGMIRPDRFITLAEQFGLIVDIGNTVLAGGVATLARWAGNEATRHLRLAVNISVQSFYADDFVAFLSSLIASHGIDASKLTLEVTEHVMARDHALIADRMRDLKKLGVRLSLDDFGTGYSSLAYLKKLPFDEVKIDGGFVADIETTESDRALVKTILAMARTLGLTAVAEHVETIRQEAFLRAYGCDYFQGFLYSPAVSAEDFEALLGTRRPYLTAAPAPALRQPA